MTTSQNPAMLSWETSGDTSRLLRMLEYLPVSAVVTSSLLVLFLLVISFIGMISQLLFSGDWMLIFATSLLLIVALRTVGIVYLHEISHTEGVKSYYQTLVDLHHTYNLFLLFGTAAVLGTLVWYSRFAAIAVGFAIVLSTILRFLLGDEGTVNLAARTIETGGTAYPLEAITALRMYRAGSIAVLRIFFDTRALQLADLPGYRTLTVSLTTASLETLYPTLDDARQQPVGAAIRQGADPPESWRRLAERYERSSPATRNRWERVTLGLFGLGFLSIGPFLWILIPPSSRREIAGVIVYISILMSFVGGGCLWYALGLESRFSTLRE